MVRPDEDQRALGDRLAAASQLGPKKDDLLGRHVIAAGTPDEPLLPRRGCRRNGCPWSPASGPLVCHLGEETCVDQVRPQSRSIGELVGPDAIRAGRADVGWVIVDEEDVLGAQVECSHQVIEDFTVGLDESDASGDHDAVEERQPVEHLLSMGELLGRPVT